MRGVEERGGGDEGWGMSEGGVRRCGMRVEGWW